jgi:hypothetical protein
MCIAAMLAGCGGKRCYSNLAVNSGMVLAFFHLSPYTVLESDVRASWRTFSASCEMRSTEGRDRPLLYMNRNRVIMMSGCD